MDRQLLEYHPTFGHRFIPGLRARIDHEGGGYLVKANQTGFRCEHEFVAEKKPDKRRVLLFGDSYTAGDGVSNQYRYGDRLEQLLPDLEVYNFGVSGTGTDQQYLMFSEYAKLFDHDAVVIGILVENIRRVAARYRQYASVKGKQFVFAKPYFTLHPHTGELELHHIPVPRDPLLESELGTDSSRVDRGGRFAWLRGTVNRAGPTIKELAQRLTQYQPLPAYSRPSSPEWRLMRAILMRWIRESTKPVLICVIPLHQYVEGTSSAKGYQARFRELADDCRQRALQVEIHDPLADLHRHSASTRRGFRFARDCHPTVDGHRALAESLVPAIARILPKPEEAVL